jgi:hypothetical protein
MDRDLPATAFGPIFGSIGVVGGVLEGDPLLLRRRHRAAVAGPESPAQTALSPRIPCVPPPHAWYPDTTLFGPRPAVLVYTSARPPTYSPNCVEGGSPTLRQSRAVATFLYLPTERAWPESALRALRICPRMGRSAATASSLS